MRGMKTFLLLSPLVLLALAACSPDRTLDTGSPEPEHYCPCDIPPPPPDTVQPNLF
jgi:hypothetical protein